jgi:hypothetical protein
MTSSKRSNQRANTTERAVFAIAVALLVSLGCTHFRSHDVVPADDGCALVDSALSGSGLRGGIEARGRVTIDVNQYRVRGRFVMTVTPGGDLTFDIVSTTMIGGHREDAVLSFYADTLRVLDRERGRFYQGADVDAMVADGAGLPVDLGVLHASASARWGRAAETIGWNWTDGWTHGRSNSAWNGGGSRRRSGRCRYGGGDAGSAWRCPTFGTEIGSNVSPYLYPGVAGASS